jgi:hypothetical protein
MKLLEKIKAWSLVPRNKSFLISVLAMLIVAVLVNLFNSSKPETTSVALESADTYIPEGFVLVPIELENVNSISSLVGEFAIVDLFYGPLSKKVGRRLRLLRAPLNPNQYAVLVEEKEVQNLLSTPGPYWAVIQNPNQNKKSIIEKQSKRSRIEYFNGR